MVETLLEEDVTAIGDDYAFEAKQWLHYIEYEIGFILPRIQCNGLENYVNQTASTHGVITAQLWQQLPHNDVLRQQLLDNILIHESRFFHHLPSIKFITE